MNLKRRYRFREPAPWEYDHLRNIWEDAIRHSHHFLTEQDIHFYRDQIIPHYFPKVTLLCACEADSNPMGFVGWHDHHIEMLFVASPYWNQGVGSALLKQIISEPGVWTLDVNEDNPQACQFYRSYGFVEIGRSPVDGQGNPFPLIHMKLIRQ